MKELRCPKCGNYNIWYDKEYRPEEEYGWKICKYWKGHCLNCNSFLKWDEEYIFNNFSPIEIDE